MLYARASEAELDASLSRDSRPTHTQQPLEDVWTKAVVSLLAGIDPALPSLLKFTDLLADTTRKTNAIGQGSEGQGSEGQGSEGLTSPDRGGQGREGRAGTLASAKSRDASELEQSEKASFALVSYAGVKVENLPTLFPDRQLRFRPLDRCMSIRSIRQHTAAYVSIRICRRSSLIGSCASSRSTGA